MVLVYTDSKSSRVEYAFGLIFKELLGCKVSITSDEDEYNSAEGVALWYSSKKCNRGIQIIPAGLLSYRGINVINPATVIHDDIVSLFPVEMSALPYDPFSAAFYLVTRYEEYLPFRADMHGRFTAGESFSAKNGFLQIPVVNHYARHVKACIQKSYPGFNPPGTQYRFTLSVDVDAAWAMKNKGSLRTAGAIFRDLKKWDIEALRQRINILRGKEDDPFDSFNYLFTYQRRRQIEMIFFILLGDYGRYDKNINWQNIHFQDLIKRIGDYAELGIRPSYDSRSNPAQVKEEIQRLETITRRKVLKSRQHFLRLDMPATYRTLASMGITEDFTMGFAANVGFRAGICTPYYFYDLETEQISGLRIFPFAFMDGTLKDYLKKTPQQAKETIDLLIDEVKKVDGHFIALWHNESLGDKGLWNGWREVCDYMIEKGNTL
ncbi:MAG: hypothetical protein C0593_12100 [Marinilabiliales bacterium]|nr:MAG: hypothetical protein C0593_12100 [Marinilabiliales bacterium]